MHFLNLAEEALSGDLDMVLQRISAAVAERRPAFVFVDSFRSVVQAIEAHGVAPTHLQKFVQELGVLMTSWQATTFLVGEYLAESGRQPGLHRGRRNHLDEPAGATQFGGRGRLKSGRCVDSRPSPDFTRFASATAGITVYPPAAVEPQFEIRGARSVPETRLRMGVPSLDEMMGGGLPRGYSLLVAGPSGSGKSLLAAAFLAEGARTGERGVIVPFEQHPNRSRSPLVTDLVESGVVTLVKSACARSLHRGGRRASEG